MAYVTRNGEVGMRGFDTSQANLVQADYAQLFGLGYRFGVRYVANSSPSKKEPPITAQELDALTSAGLGVMIVQYARSAGWSQQSGLADGKAGAENLLALGLPATTCLWFDLALQGLAVGDAITYANACVEGAIQGGMSADALGAYFEPGVPLSEDQLYALAVKRYWRSGAQVPNVAHRGYQLLQLWPSDIMINRSAGPGVIEIDVDFIQQDYLGSIPVLGVAQ